MLEAIAGPAGAERGLINTAGEFERERKSRRYNAIEPLLVYSLVLGAQWPLAYWFDVLHGVEAASTLAISLLTVGSLYLLFVSPYIHGDSLDSWGLGNPRVLWRMLTQASPAKRVALAGVIAAMVIGLNVMNFRHWDEVTGFLNLDKTAVLHFPEHHAGQLAMLLFGSSVSMLIVTCAIRYDNFLPAFATAMKIALPMFAGICLAAYVHRGPAAFRDFTPGKFSMDVFGYIFWGFTQQLLFSSYFGTRLRKAFGPSMLADNRVARPQRLRLAIQFGAGFASVLAVVLYFGLRALYGGDAMNMRSVLYIVAFTLPFGAVYGWFWGVDRKRLLVATLTASFFGLIHIDSYGLVLGTWVLGIMLVYVFMEHKNRNLVALGCIHGLLGSTFGWLFSSGESGAFEIDYSVGPWNVDDPTPAALIVPVLCLLAYLGLAWWSKLRLEGRPEARPAA